MTTSTPTDTVVLVHGLWVTPRSWEHWVPYYEAKGYRVITPAYPGFDIEVEALRQNPDVIANLTVPETVDHLAGVIEALDSAPIIIGHSFGGTVTQLLLARGLGSAGVVIDSAPTEGVHVTPLSQIRSFFPALKNPANIHKAVAFTAEEFHYAFANYDQDRAPLLFIGGEKDHIMPPSVNKSNARHYENSPALTEYFEFEGRDHWTCGAPGWEDVADYALEWAAKHPRATIRT
jgi:pimeloyl-ACP methyl ester carboxylesterase